MLPYLFTFSLSTLFTYLAQNQFKFKKKIYGVLCSSIAILLPSLLAGFRAETIGTDTSYYPVVVMDAVNSYSNLFEGISYTTASLRFELGYVLLAYFSSIFSSSVQLFLFFTHFIIIYYVYKSLYVYRDQMPMWLGMLLYLTVYYCVSLNMMRQSMAMAIVLYATTFLEQKKYKQYFIYIGIGSLFHSSAWLGMLFFFIPILLGKNVKKWKMNLALLVVLVLLLNWHFVSDFIIGLNVIPARYNSYFNGSIGSVSTNVWATVHIPLFLFEWYYEKKMKLKTPQYSFYYFITLISIVLIPLDTIAKYAWRILFYFNMFRVFTTPMALASVHYKGNKQLFSLIIIMVLIAWWFGSFVYMGSHQTYPYVAFWAS